MYTHVADINVTLSGLLIYVLFHFLKRKAAHALD